MLHRVGARRAAPREVQATNFSSGPLRRASLWCKEIWVVGAERWRNPDEDLPGNFEHRRGEHYAALRTPLDPAAFIDQLADLPDQKLWRIDPAADYGPLNAAARGKVSSTT